ERHERNGLRIERKPFVLAQALIRLLGRGCSQGGRTQPNSDQHDQAEAKCRARAKAIHHSSTHLVADGRRAVVSDLEPNLRDIKSAAKLQPTCPEPIAPKAQDQPRRSNSLGTSSRVGKTKSGS